MMITENNKVTVSGEIVGNFEFSHCTHGEKFFTAHVESKRKSEIEDTVPITVPERLIDAKKDWSGRYVQISGQLRSYNWHDEEKNRLILSVFVKDFAEAPCGIDLNSIFLDGYICKKPTCRKTPFGKRISDVLLAVNRSYGKSDYVPCIFWGRNALFVEQLDVGTNIRVFGRIQSREYSKNISIPYKETETMEHKVVRRTAYEVSARELEVVSHEQKSC